ncbi:MAG: hypothetical protein Q9157_001306 [Trypethelium eluteriae]
MRCFIGNLEKRKTSDFCPVGETTTLLGQIFSTSLPNAGCHKDLPSNDLIDVQQDDIASLEDCMNWCAPWGGGGIVYGVAFDFSSSPGTCYCKGQGVLNNTTYVANASVHSALTVNVNPNPYLQCPYQNASTQVATDGSKYEIYCNQDMPEVDDMCPVTSPTYNVSANSLCPTHADSLQDCMNQCTAAHGLCLAVVYLPSMFSGYGNCYYKNNVSTGSFDPKNSIDPPVHMAILDQDNVWDVDSSCINGTNYTSPNGAIFEISCNTNDNTPFGTDIMSFYSKNMSACADACATYTNSSGYDCVGVVFDSSLTDGYQNCYLKSIFGVVAPMSGHQWALLAQRAQNTSTNSSSEGAHSPFSNPAPSLSSSSKTWVAGPVIGAVIGVAMIAGLFFWLRRHRQLSQSNKFTSDMASLPYLKERPYGQPEVGPFEMEQEKHIPEMHTERSLQEMDPDQIRQELGGNPVLGEVPEQYEGDSM